MAVKNQFRDIFQEAHKAEQERLQESSCQFRKFESMHLYAAAMPDNTVAINFY